MKIERTEIAIRDLVDDYSDDGEGGFVGYSGRLDIRPPYQREFVYKERQRDDVIRSVLAGFPLNVMYWAMRPDGRYEVLDGQQRTISLSQYVSGDFSIDGLYYSNQPDDVRDRIDGYELTIYLCDGDASEKLRWFEIVNIASEALTRQELRNAVYAGPWVSDAKRYFSRTGCAAKAISDTYQKKNPIRQELLEMVIRWASGGKIDDYMALLKDSYRAENLPTVMCRDTISVDWQGDLFDCDFNQMLGMPAMVEGRPARLADLVRDGRLERARIATADHCFGCTAGQGSSCTGALDG